jgi:hypothetical protein
MASVLYPDKPRLILVAIDKGGVGKSFFCIQLVSWLRRHSVKFTAFDPDFANSTLSRFVPEATFLNIRHRENLDVLVESMERTPIVVLDGMVGRQGLIFDWIEETDLTQLSKEMNFGITLALVLEDDKDTVHQAGEAVKRLGGSVDWLVIRNHRTYDHFRLYETSKARENLLRHGAMEIDMPRLQSEIMHSVQKQSTTLDTALESGGFHLLDRQRILQYQRTFFAELDRVQAILV